MAELLAKVSLFPLALTLGTFLFGVWLQKKVKSPLCNPILVSVILVAGILLALEKLPGLSLDSTAEQKGLLDRYLDGTQGITWLLTPATVCLALPLYEQLKILRKNLPAILAGVLAGTVTSLVVVLGMCHLMGTDRTISVSLLPKSITTAMGIVLSGENGGIEALTTTVIIVTGIIGALTGSILCKIFRFRSPIVQGVAFGTASHVVGTSRANELSVLTGAVSSLSLAVSGIFTAILFPIACKFLPV